MQSSFLCTKNYQKLIMYLHTFCKTRNSNVAYYHQSLESTWQRKKNQLNLPVSFELISVQYQLDFNKFVHGAPKKGWTNKDGNSPGLVALKTSHRMCDVVSLGYRYSNITYLFFCKLLSCLNLKFSTVF